MAARRIRLEPAGLFETWARPLTGGKFAALLWSRNDSCLANDDSNVHLDPTPQIFWRSLGFRGSAEVIDLWSGAAQTHLFSRCHFILKMPSFYQDRLGTNKQGELNS